MNTLTFDQIFARYRAASAWIASVLGEGVRGRLKQTETIFERLCAGHADGSLFEDKAKTLRESSILSFSDALALVDVHEAFGDGPVPEVVKAQLAEVVNGPLFARDEKVDGASIRARNTLFELVLGALLAKAGAIPVDGAAGADGCFNFAGLTFLAECKRVQSLDKVEANFKKARKQLRTRLGINASQPGSIVGVAAIELSKAFDQGTRIFIDSDQAQARARLDALTLSGANRCKRELDLTTDVGILGIFFYARVLVDVSERLSVGSHWTFVQNPHANSHSEALAQLERGCSGLRY